MKSIGSPESWVGSAFSMLGYEWGYLPLMKWADIPPFSLTQYAIALLIFAFIWQMWKWSFE